MAPGESFPGDSPGNGEFLAPRSPGNFSGDPGEEMRPILPKNRCNSTLIWTKNVLKYVRGPLLCHFYSFTLVFNVFEKVMKSSYFWWLKLWKMFKLKNLIWDFCKRTFWLQQYLRLLIEAFYNKVCSYFHLYVSIMAKITSPRGFPGENFIPRGFPFPRGI